ncbi:MAG TPA: hypothetical protein ENL12_01795 [Dehalococcoidia bacterium]|nr:hypothetical protein [Dehalococcoidia bacterium]
MPGENITGGTVQPGESYVIETAVKNVAGGFQIDGTVVFKNTVNKFAGNSMIGGMAVFCDYVDAFTGSADFTDFDILSYEIS